MDLQPDTSPNTKRIDRYFYSMNERLGQGAFGTVYTGHDIENKQKLYAIKVIPVSLIKSEPALEESLMNEMQVMKLLNHPNIVRCYDVLSSSNNHYFVMEYCSGGTLGSLLKKKGKLEESEALVILIQILKGYHEMLKLGVIHRDLKPENILIHEGVFKLADFGFSKCVDNFSKDLLKSLVGTPLYMSPQILKQEEYSTKTDLWSIALIYYEMLCGKTPWDAKTQFELVKKMLSQPVKFPEDVKISEESRSFIIDALKIDENCRLSWDQVFSHELFHDCFDYRRRKTTLKEKAVNYQGMLKAKIVEKNIDLYKLFSIIDKNNNNELEMSEFAELMKKLDDKISREQIEFIYNSIDEDGNNSISLMEFRKWLVTSTSNSGSSTNLNQSQKNNLQRNQSLPMAHIPPLSPFKNQNYPVKDNTGFGQSQAQAYPNLQPMQGSQYPYNNNKGPNKNNIMQGPNYNNNNNMMSGYNNNNNMQDPNNNNYMNQEPNYNSNMMQEPNYNNNMKFNNNMVPNNNMMSSPNNMQGSLNYNQQYPPQQPNFMPPIIPQMGFNNVGGPEQFPQNQYGYNLVPMLIGGPPMNNNNNNNVNHIIDHIRFYIQKTHSNVEKVFNLAKGYGDQNDLGKKEFENLIQMINLPVMFNEGDLDMIFREFDRDRDGKISLNEFKKRILNI